MISCCTNWWTVALRGVLAILFGILAFLTPGIALISLVLLFGIYALIDGTLSTVAAIRLRHGEPRWWAMLLAGLAGITAGVIAFLYPGLTALTLVYVIGAWAIVVGAFQIVAAIRLRREISGEWLLALIGALCILFGMLMFAAPAAGALTLVFWIGAFAIIVGSLFLVLGFRMRRWARHTSGLYA